MRKPNSSWSQKVNETTDPDELRIDGAEKLMAHMQSLSDGLQTLSDFVARRILTPEGEVFAYGDKGGELGERITAIQDEIMEASAVLGGAPPEVFNDSIQKKASAETLQASGLEGIQKILIDTDGLMRDFETFTQEGNVTVNSRNYFEGMEMRLTQLADKVDRPLGGATRVMHDVFKIPLSHLPDLLAESPDFFDVA